MAVSRTAQYMALYRALETATVHPRLRDPFAVAFLPRVFDRAVRAARLGPLRLLLAAYADVRAPGARTSAIARTLFIDDVCRHSMASGVQQLVLLGAGFDCRAHRLTELDDCDVFEIDRPDTQAFKRARLAHTGLPMHSDVRYVAVDFLRDDVGAALSGAGWDAERSTLFVWEGVTNYLTESAVAGVLSWIGGAAPGSRVVFTYVHAGLLDGSARFFGGARILDTVRALGEPWTFGLRPDAVAAFVARAGLTIGEDAGADDYRRRYLGRTFRGYAFYRIAVADVSERARRVVTLPGA
jgi:methyltransferase (TIGR00027 family)